MPDATVNFASKIPRYADTGELEGGQISQTSFLDGP